MAITGRLRRALLSRIGGALRVRKGRRRPVLDKNLFALPGARRMLGALCLLRELMLQHPARQHFRPPEPDLYRTAEKVVKIHFSPTRS